MHPLSVALLIYILVQKMSWLLLFQLSSLLYLFFVAVQALPESVSVLGLCPKPGAHPFPMGSAVIHAGPFQVKFCLRR